MGLVRLAEPVELVGLGPRAERAERVELAQ